MFICGSIMRDDESNAAEQKSKTNKLESIRVCLRTHSCFRRAVARSIEHTRYGIHMRLSTTISCIYFSSCDSLIIYSKPIFFRNNMNHPIRNLPPTSSAKTQVQDSSPATSQPAPITALVNCHTTSLKYLAGTSRRKYAFSSSASSYI